MIACVVSSGWLPSVGETVRALRAQGPAIGEIVVCGPDAHGVLPSGDPALTVLADLPPGPACHGYNAALAHLFARPAGAWDAVAIVDGDATPEAGWAAAVLARLAGGWDGVGSAVVVPDGPPLSVAYNLTTFHPWRIGLPAELRAVLPTVGLCVRRAAAGAAGPFRTDMPRLYDFDWTARLTDLGFRLGFAPEARLAHQPVGITPGILWRTWYAGGSCSQALRRARSDRFGSAALLDHPRLLLALAPAIALARTAAVAAAWRADRRIWRALGWVYVTKLAWCLGASHGRRHGPVTLDGYRFVPPPRGS